MQPSTKRLEYIDAMRGFTMLLVVFSHVIVFGYHGLNTATYNTAFVQFRMPLFFFISGFVLYKATRVWDYATCCSFLKNKFMVQIVSTAFFFIVYHCLFKQTPLKSGLLDIGKSGYWFTVTLFEFFVLYAVMSFCIYKWGGRKADGYLSLWC